MNSQQYGYLNKTCIMTTLAHMPTQGRVHEFPPLDKELQAITGY